MRLRSKNLLLVCFGLLAGSGLIYPYPDTPLMVAVRDGSFEEVDRLITSGVDVNEIAQSDWPHVGISALGIALRDDKSIEIIKKLIAAGANVNEYIEPSSYVFNDIIRDKGAPWEHLVARNHPLLSFVVGAKKSIERVKLLIDSGADVNKLDLYRQGVTPLMVAQLVGYDEAIPLLKKAGAREVTLPDYGSWIMKIITQATNYIKSFFVSN